MADSSARLTETLSHGTKPARRTADGKPFGIPRIERVAAALDLGFPIGWTPRVTPLVLYGVCGVTVSEYALREPDQTGSDRSLMGR
jgi:hypothetical protein